MQTKVYPTIKDIPGGVILPKQVHGERIVELINGSEDLSECDGIFTKNKDLIIGIRTADCAPICFSDGEKIGIVHAGWPGLCLSIIENILKNFNPESVEVFVGPFMHSFEIKRDFCYEKIVAKFGEQFFSFEEDRIVFHFKDAVASLLPESVKFDLRNTFVDTSLPSHRRDKTEGRLVTVVKF